MSSEVCGNALGRRLHCLLTLLPVGGDGKVRAGQFPTSSTSISLDIIVWLVDLRGCEGSGEAGNYYKHGIKKLQESPG